MKRLYDDNERYTDAANAIDAAANAALRPIFDKAVAEGWSPRDIQSVVCGTVSEIAMIHVLNVAAPKTPYQPFSKKGRPSE